MCQMDTHGIGARLRALRLLAGYTNVKALANALHERGTGKGLGQTSLRQMEREEIISDPRNLQEIADLCGVPLAWFSADFSRLDEISEEPRTVIARETASVAERVEARRAAKSSSHQPRTTRAR